MAEVEFVVGEDVTATKHARVATESEPESSLLPSEPKGYMWHTKKFTENNILLVK